MKITNNISHKKILLFILFIILTTISITLFSISHLNFVPHIISSTGWTESEPFPEINNSNLNPTQQKIIEILKKEFKSQPDGTKYSEGIEEYWCADFVSWIMKEAGVPFNNPNSGSWRIPGVYTLREYFESIDKFKTGDSGYSPKVGDIMIYDNPSPFGQHTNIVIKNDNGVITTIGGNENNKIRIYTHKESDKVGIVGYGLL